MAYPCGFGLCKGGSLLIHAGQSEEEPTLCKKHPSAQLRAGSFDLAQGRPFGWAQGRPFGWTQGKQGCGAGVNYVLRVRVKDVSHLRRLALFMRHLPSAYPSTLLRAGALG